MDLKTYRIWELISLPHYRAVLRVWKKERNVPSPRNPSPRATRSPQAWRRVLTRVPTDSHVCVHSFLVSLLFSGCWCLHSVTRLWFNSCGHVLLAGCSMNWLIPPWERKAMGYG
jgi:hypothetical protein